MLIEDIIEAPGERAPDLTINTLAELCEQIDYVIAHPDQIGGFDCTLNREVLADQESKKRAMGYAIRGHRIKIVGADGSATHIVARVLVTLPQKVSGRLY